MPKPSDSRNIRVMQFLDAYEKQESLWNPALESYKNKQARDEAYLNIISELNSPSLTINDVKLKVKSIRTTYTKELRTLTKHNEEGRSYIPKLFWFSRANSFLKRVSLARDRGSSTAEKLNSPPLEPFKSSCIMDYISEIPRQQNLSENNSEKISSIDDAQTTTCSTYEYKDLNSRGLNNELQDVKTNATQSTRTASGKRIDSIDEDDISNPALNSRNCKYDEMPSINSSRLSAHSVVTKQPQTVHSDKLDEDEYDLFCRSVAVQLRSIADPYSRAVAKLKIQQILFEAETGHYESNTTNSLPVCNNVSSLPT